MTAITLRIRAVQNRVFPLSFQGINWKAFYILTTLLALPMLFFYIYTVNGLTKGVYTIKNYNKELNSVLQENRLLESNFNRTNLLENVIQQAKDLSFEKTANIKYVSIQNQSSALAKAGYENQ